MRRDESSQMKHSEHDKLFALKWMPRLRRRDNQALVLHHLSFGQKLIGEVMGIMWTANGCAACHKISFALTTTRREAAVSHRRHVIGVLRLPPLLLVCFGLFSVPKPGQRR